jgi:hypothetical protein
VLNGQIYASKYDKTNSGLRGLYIVPPSYVYLGEMRMREFLYFPPKSPDLKMGKKLASAVFLALRASCKRAQRERSF